VSTDRLLKVTIAAILVVVGLVALQSITMAGMRRDAAHAEVRPAFLASTRFDGEALPGEVRSLTARFDAEIAPGEIRATGARFDSEQLPAQSHVVRARFDNEELPQVRPAPTPRFDDE
jgi:hypothetical protein